MATQSFVRSRPPSEMTVRAEALLRRYPKLSEHELTTLIEIFPRLRILDVGLMTADDRLSGQLEAFHRDHGGKFTSPISTMIGLLSFPVILGLGVLWWHLGPAFGS